MKQPSPTSFPKKIYFLLDFLGGIGGVEKVLLLITNALQQKGYDIAVLLPYQSICPAWEQELPCIYYYDTEPPIFSDEYFLQSNKRSIGLSKLMKEIGPPDVLIATHVPTTALYSRLLLGQLQDIKIVSWLHSPLSVFRAKENIMYADYHWVISKSIALELQEWGITPNQITYIGNPIFTNVPIIPPSKDNKFLFIGRLVNSEKCLDRIFLSLSMLEAPWTLDVYGDGSDYESLLRLAERLNISEHITFHGYHPDVWNQVKEATALLLASNYEGFGLVVVEAFARGIPVISTMCTGPLELIEHGKTGYLVPVGDIGAFTGAIQTLLSLSTSEREEMSKHAIVASKSHDITHVVDAIEEFFEKKLS